MERWTKVRLYLFWVLLIGGSVSWAINMVETHRMYTWHNVANEDGIPLWWGMKVRENVIVIEEKLDRMRLQMDRIESLCIHE